MRGIREYGDRGDLRARYEERRTQRATDTRNGRENDILVVQEATRDRTGANTSARSASEASTNQRGQTSQPANGGSVSQKRNSTGQNGEVRKAGTFQIGGVMVKGPITGERHILI